MPARIVDGDDLWRSSKLKKVPVRFRAEYANLIPLAEANGSFECEPELIWSQVYSYNRTDITPVIVKEILDEFENADMLHRYETNGKQYGYWIGIEKEGRLPPPSQRSRYKNLPPEPPHHASAILTPEEMGEFMGVSSSRVAEVRAIMGSTLPLDTQIERMCNEVIGHSEERKVYAKDLKAAVKQYGHDEVLAAFELWVNSQSGFVGRKPVSLFLKNLGNLIHNVLPAATVTSPALGEVEAEIASITDSQVFFHNQQKPLLASLIKLYSKEEVLQVFNDYWNSVGIDDNIAWAAKNFIEQAGLRIETMRAKKKRQENKDSIVKDAVAKAAQSVATELVEEEVEDNL